jgi:hypothetical protein
MSRILELSVWCTLLFSSSRQSHSTCSDATGATGSLAAKPHGSAPKLWTSQTRLCLCPVSLRRSRTVIAGKAACYASAIKIKLFQTRSCSHFNCSGSKFLLPQLATIKATWHLASQPTQPLFQSPERGFASHTRSFDSLPTPHDLTVVYNLMQLAGVQGID